MKELRDPHFRNEKTKTEGVKIMCVVCFGAWSQIILLSQIVCFSQCNLRHWSSSQTGW